MRRLKTGLGRAATSIPVMQVEEERWNGDTMAFRIRALGQIATGQVDVADDHVIAFARSRGRAAAVVVVGRQFAPFTQAGREWPTLEGFDATVDISGYTAPGLAGNELPLAQAFRDFPAAVIEARTASVIRHARRPARA